MEHVLNQQNANLESPATPGSPLELLHDQPGGLLIPKDDRLVNEGH